MVMGVADLQQFLLETQHVDATTATLDYCKHLIQTFEPDLDRRESEQRLAPAPASALPPEPMSSPPSLLQRVMTLKPSLEPQTAKEYHEPELSHWGLTALLMSIHVRGQGLPPRCLREVLHSFPLVFLSMPMPPIGKRP